MANEREISDFYANALPFLKARGLKIWDPQGLLRISALFNYKIQGKMAVQEIKGIQGKMAVQEIKGICRRIENDYENRYRRL